MSLRGSLHIASPWRLLMAIVVLGCGEDRPARGPAQGEGDGAGEAQGRGEGAGDAGGKEDGESLGEGEAAGEGEGEPVAGQEGEGVGEADGVGQGEGEAIGEGEGEGEGGAAEDPELWVYIRKNLQTVLGRDETLALIDRAAAAGYTGIGLADFKFTLVHTGTLIERYEEHLRQVNERIAERGLDLLVAMFPFGYSEGILRADPNLAEGRPIRGAPFVVSADGATLEHAPAFGGLTNPGFEDWQEGVLGGWDWHDEPGVRTSEDRQVFRSGAASLRVDAGEGNARAVQTLAVRPRRQYRVWWHVRTEGLTADWHNVMLLDGSGRSLSFHEVHFEEDQDWTRGEYVIDSGSSETLRLYLGLWERSAGTAWFDDVGVEEVALVNLVRRPGAPVAASDSAGQPVEEGVDIDRVPGRSIESGPEFLPWEAPVVIGLPEGSRLVPGAAVSIDYYAVAPVYGWQVGACLTEPAVDEWMTANMAALDQRFPPGTGWFFGYDEMRHMNTCAACTGTGLSTGELLAGHVRRAVAVVRARRPVDRLYAWNDMFDPHHNAGVNYYLGEGDLAGSWLGLPEDLILMNWNGVSRAESMAHFEALGNRQIIAGYYDSGDGAASASREVEAGSPSPGFLGLMYTTWRDDYAQLEAYANAAREAWPD